MSVALYMDVHVHSAITEALRTRGVDVLTAQEDETTELLDPDLLRRATTLNRVIFTNDQDFLQIVPDWQQRGEPFAGVIYAPQTTPLGRIINDLEMCAMICEPEDYTDSVTYLPFPIRQTH